jgi:hypothetical protein
VRTDGSPPDSSSTDPADQPAADPVRAWVPAQSLDLREILSAIQTQIDALGVSIHAQQQILNALIHRLPDQRPAAVIRPSPRRRRDDMP